MELEVIERRVCQGGGVRVESALGCLRNKASCKRKCKRKVKTPFYIDTGFRFK